MNKARRNNLSKLLFEGVNELLLTISEQQLDKLMRYMEALVDENRKINLTAIEDPKEIIIKHFLDAITPLKYIKIEDGASIIDIGAGAGFPGIPIKIMRPDIGITMVEAAQKKSQFIKRIIKILEIDKADVYSERAEQLAHKLEHREAYDVAVTRAVADTAVLAEYMLPFLSENGLAILYKGKTALDEAKKAKYAIDLLGGCIEEVVEVVVPFLGAERYLTLIRKVSQSPPKYPRKAGIPAKKPLL